MKILFIGCISISRIMLNALLKNGETICGIVCVPEKFRASTSGYDDLSDISEKHNIPIFKSRRLHTRRCKEFIKTTNPDIMVVYGWQRIIKSDILNIPKKASIGFHASLLPKYRGSAPVNWVIINGETETGVTMFELDGNIDTGPIYGQKAFEITTEDTCATVYEKSAKAACELIIEKLNKSNFSTYINNSKDYPIMPRRRPEDGKIDWNKPSFVIYNWIRALTKPYPGAFTIINNKKYIFWTARLESPQFNLKPGEFKFSKNKIICGTSDNNLLITNYEVKDEI